MASMLTDDYTEDSTVRNPDSSYVDCMMKDEDVLYVPPECPEGVSLAEWQDILNQSMFDEEERKISAENERNLKQMLSECNEQMKRSEAIKREEFRVLRNNELKNREDSFSVILKALHRGKQFASDNDKEVLGTLIHSLEVYVKDNCATDIRVSEEDFEAISNLLESSNLKKLLKNNEKERLMNLIAIAADDSEDYVYDDTDC